MTDSIKYTLGEDRIPRSWYNLSADLPSPPPPVLHPGLGKPIGPDDLAPLFPMALMARYTRASTLEVINSDYVRMGRARGLSERRVVFLYIFYTSLIPLITIMGPQIPNILTGSIFIEATFALPGLGSYFTTASLHRDYPLIMALVLILRPAGLFGRE